MKKIKIAAIQAASRAANWGEKWDGVDVPYALAWLDKAKAAGADLACFPELYPLVGGDRLKAKAKELGIHVIAGLAEGKPDRWYNTSVIISPKGEIVGSQTKNYPTAGEEDNGVVAGTEYRVFETELGRFGIVICADFAFFVEGVDKSRAGNADIIFNPAVWFALAEGYPHTVAGRHLEYSVPIIGVNLARPENGRNDSTFPPAGGFTTVCVPPPVKNMDELWEWFRSKPEGIDSTAGFIHTLGRGEEMYVTEVDIDAVRAFPGYFSSRVTDRSRAANAAAA
jgi:predicted amidohydrolase